MRQRRLGGGGNVSGAIGCRKEENMYFIFVAAVFDFPIVVKEEIHVVETKEGGV